MSITSRQNERVRGQRCVESYLLPKGDIVFKDFVGQWLHLAKAGGDFGRIYAQFVK